MPTNNLIEFILYVIPGFIAVEIYRATYPVRERSEFQQIGWSIFFGLVIVSVVKWADTNLLSNSLYSRPSGLPGLRFTFSLVIFGILTGVSLVGLHKIRISLSQKYEGFKSLAPDSQSIWAKINQPTNKDWCVIYLDDDSIYLGYISQYTFDPDNESQDFLLSDAKCVDEKLNEKYLITGIGVYLNTKDVKRIEYLKGQ